MIRTSLRSMLRCAAVAATLAFPSAAGAVNVTSAFTTGADGWRLYGISECDSVLTAPDFRASGGNPGGYISGHDAQPAFGGLDTCHWAAIGPAAYTGQRRANYGGQLRVDVRHPAGAEFGPWLEIHDDGGNALYRFFDDPPAANAWTTHAATLTEAGGVWFYLPSGATTERVATRADFFEVLEDVRFVAVGADLTPKTSGVETHLDTIALLEPASPLDSDGDGVGNGADSCPLVPGTSAGSGCPAPGKPTIVGTDPGSGGDANAPKVRGTMGTGAATSVEIFASATCAGSPIASGAPAAFTGAGLEITVPDDSTTPLSAQASSAAGDSPCSNSITYVESTPDPGPSPEPTPDPQPTPSLSPTPTPTASPSPTAAEVDLKAPDTRVTRRPKRRAKAGRVTFAFTATEPGGRYECRLDRRVFARCSSPVSYRVRPGRHSFRVRAIDADGNVDASPVVVRWTAVRRAR